MESDEFGNAIAQMLIMEIVLAGATVLRDSFSFTEEQIDEWLTGTLATAEARRSQLEVGVAISALS